MGSVVHRWAAVRPDEFVMASPAVGVRHPSVMFGLAVTRHRNETVIDVVHRLGKNLFTNTRGVTLRLR